MQRERNQLRNLWIGQRALKYGWLSNLELANALKKINLEENHDAIWLSFPSLNTQRLLQLKSEFNQNNSIINPSLDDAITIAHGATLIHYKSPKTGDLTDSSSSQSLPQLNLAQTPLTTTKNRYTIEEEIGRGGSSRVFKAFDRALGRTIAMKVMRLPTDGQIQPRVHRFIHEARLTGRLEHPNIIPVYDVGLLQSGEAYFTMKLLRRRSLRPIIQAIGRNDPMTAQEFGIPRLLHIFLSICQAIAYAHARGVVHRDLKPDNIVLGEYGEVLVTDWGLARAIATPAERLSQQPGAPSTLGTPAYMPPEQALGQLELVDELSDIYSLGAILYEILTCSPPYQEHNALAILEKVAQGPPPAPSERSPERNIPHELEQLCLWAMARDRAQRPKDARELVDAIIAFNQALPQREASKKTAKGQALAIEYTKVLAFCDTLKERIRQLQEELAPHQPLREKQPLWRAQDQLKQSQRRLAQTFSDAISAFTQALAYDPSCSEARNALSDLYWSRFLDATKANDIAEQIHYKALIQEMDLEKRYQKLLKGSGTLILNTTPKNAHLTLHLLKENNRILVPEFQASVQTPATIDKLPMGSYIAQIDLCEHHRATYPLAIDRCATWKGQLQLLPKGTIPEGFIHVPAGPFISGGDPSALNAPPETKLDIDDFLIAKSPITFGEYIQFINALQLDDPAQALARVPGARDGDGLLLELRGNQWHPKDLLIEGEARERYPLGEGHELRLPLIAVSVEDALAYIHWLSREHNRSYRLPRTDEWEKAARGVDGRAYPWGNHFDATFCKMRLSRPEPPQPEPVNTFPTDTSVYGVRDLAGGVQEWCADGIWKLGDILPETSPVRGGSWTHHQDGCRAANNVRILSIGRMVSLGFRLASDI